jgi:hypothetical protein
VRPLGLGSVRRAAGRGWPLLRLGAALAGVLLATVGAPARGAPTSQEGAAAGAARAADWCGVDPPAPGATPAESAVPVTLVVEVWRLGRGGAAPRPDQPPRPPVRLGPGADALVQVVAADAPAVLVAEGVTDVAGRVTFALPPGRYWVFVPWEAAVPGVPAGVASGGNRPDGRPVLAWTEATLEADGPVEVTLNLSLALP